MRDVQDVKLVLYSWRFTGFCVVLVVAMALNLELNTERYIGLMEKLIGETEFLQNNPPRYVPQEDRYWLREHHVMGLVSSSNPSSVACSISRAAIVFCIIIVSV